MIIPAVFGTDPDSDRIGVVVKTIVTTELVRKIADEINFSIDCRKKSSMVKNISQKYWKKVIDLLIF